MSLRYHRSWEPSLLRHAAIRVRVMGRVRVRVTGRVRVRVTGRVRVRVTGRARVRARPLAPPTLILTQSYPSCRHLGGAPQHITCAA